ncbi:MAG: hypothetical protein ACI4RO_02475, partial [Candidatus Scatosoma sp.]
MNIIKRKILQWFSLALAALCLFVTVLSVSFDGANPSVPASANGTEQTEVTEETSGRPVAYIEGQNLNEGVAQPSSDGYVYFKIALDKAPEENVRVFYHTRDMSAIAAEGDYDAVNDSVLLTPDSYSKVLAVKVYSKGVQIQGMERGERYNDYTYWGRYIEKTRSFMVALYRAESENNIADVSDTQNALECSAGYNGVYEIAYGGGVNAYYKIFYDGVSAGNELYWESPEIDGNKSWSSKFGINGSVVLGTALEKVPEFKQFVDAGIVSVRVGLQGTIQDDNYWEYAHDVYVSVMHENMDDYPPKTTEALKLLLNSDNMKSGSVQNIGSNGNLISSTCSSNYISTSSTSFILPEPSSEDHFYFKVQNPDNSDDVWLKLKIYFTPVDIKKPEVIGCYVQDDVRIGEKLGLSLRISEPVQVLNDVKPQIKTIINGSMSNEVTFDYVSGNGTDTLYFEADIPSSLNMQITSIRVQDILNIDQICEYSYVHWNEKGECQSWGAALVQPTYTTVRCNVDLRTPLVSVRGNVPTTAI